MTLARSRRNVNLRRDSATRTWWRSH